MNKINNIAINAYQKVLKSSKTSSPQQTLKLAEQTMNVLRAGDNLEVNQVKKGAATSFPEVAKQIVSEQAESIKAPDKVRAQAFTPNSNGEVMGVDNIELIQTVNEAEATLTLVQEVRTHFVNSLQDLIKTPL